MQVLAQRTCWEVERALHRWAKCTRPEREQHSWAAQDYKMTCGKLFLLSECQNVGVNLFPDTRQSNVSSFRLEVQFSMIYIEECTKHLKTIVKQN